MGIGGGFVAFRYGRSSMKQATANAMNDDTTRSLSLETRRALARPGIGLFVDAGPRAEQVDTSVRSAVIVPTVEGREVSRSIHPQGRPEEDLLEGRPRPAHPLCLM